MPLPSHPFRVRTAVMWARSILCLAFLACEVESDRSHDDDAGENELTTPEIEILHIGTPDGPQVDNSFPDRGLEGKWTGQYKCGQGAMLLEVGINRERGGALTASIHFEPSEHATEKALGGSWKARVIYSENSRTTTFEPDSWEDQPDESYQMLLLKGRLDRPEMHVTGDVLGEQSCSKFTLTRKGAHPFTGEILEEEPEVEEDTGALFGRWEGSYSCGGNKMNLKLSVGADTEGLLQADVLFSPADGEESIMKGGHWVSSVEGGQPGSTVQFLPRTWVTQPEDEYEMLEFSGRLNEEADQITGDIVNKDGCSNVILRRSAHKR